MIVQIIQPMIKENVHYAKVLSFQISHLINTAFLKLQIVMNIVMILWENVLLV